jgi:hypothetical protein
LPAIPAFKPVDLDPSIEPITALESVLPTAALDAPPEPLPNKVLSVPELKTPLPEVRTPVPPPTGSFTNDEPPPMPPYLEPPVTDGPKAHEALMGFLRKVFPGQSH